MLMDRKALGEPLSADEEAFCRQYALENPECARELELYAELEELDATPDEASRLLVDAALARMEADEQQRQVQEASTFRQRRTPVFALVAGACAVAAGLLLFLRAPSRTGERPDGELRSAQLAAHSRAELVYASGTVTVSGKPANVGTTLLAQGNVIETADGTACLLIDPEINVCLSEHSRLRLSALDTPARKLELEAGTAATRLVTQPEGMSLSIAVGDVLSTAVGTAFSVQRAQDGGVVTTVLNGKVRVGKSNDTRIVAAHERAVTAHGTPGITTVSRSEEAPSWALLGPTVLWHDPVAAAIDVRGEPARAEAWLDDQLIGVAPLSSLVPVGSHRLVVRMNGQVLLERDLHMNAGETQAVAYLPLPLPAAGTSAPVATKVAVAHVMKSSEPVQSAKVLTEVELGLRPAEAAKPALSAADLLAEARRNLREGRFADAEKSYEAVTTSFPASEEAHTVLVSLGQLELAQLGEPARALGRFDAYLKRGGALSEEARVARVHALRALHRDAEEAAAIEELLAKHPRSFEAAELRARLEALQSAR
jgi:hypothetical protein